MDFIDIVLNQHKENKMQWNEYPKSKPAADMLCYVANNRSGVRCYMARYSLQHDLFLLEDTAIPLDITHWIELPPPPNAK
jgi:hypothetical protein